MWPANQNFVILSLVKYVKTLSFTSICLKVHGTNNLKFVILSCGYYWFQICQNSWSTCLNGNTFMAETWWFYVHIAFDIHSDSFIWMYKIHANDVFLLSWLYIQHIFKSENFQSWSAFGREFCNSNSQNQAPWYQKTWNIENHSPLSHSFKVIHFPTLQSSFSSFWAMTTWTKLNITRKPINQIRFCKKILIVENFSY